MTRDRLLLAALLALVALPYLPGLANGFVWLDHREIVEGRLLVGSLAEVPGLFLEDRNYAGYHRPVYNLLHSLDRALWGLEPFGFHLSSLVLHLANVALVVALARAAGLGRGAALALGGLFGLHPIHTAAVGLIHAKADLFVVTTLGGSLLFLLRGVRVPPARPLERTGACVGAVLAFAVALGTKELAFAFPLGLGLAWALGLRPAPATARAFGAVLGTVGALTLLALLRRLGDADAYVPPVPLGERLLTFATVYVDAVRRLLVPTAPFVGDTVTRFGALPPGAQARALTTFALLAAAQLGALRAWPASRPWILVFNLGLLPVSQVVPILHFRADRFLYLPSIGLLGVVVAGGAALVERAPRAPWAARAQRALPLLVAAVLALFAWRSAARVRVFVDDETLFRAELALVPDYVEGQAALARALDRQGRHAEATALWLAALEPDPDRIGYQNLDVIVVNLGNSLIAQGRHGEAYALLRELRGRLASAEARRETDYHLAVAAYRLERYAEALPGFRAYALHAPDDAPTQLMLGAAALGVGETELARAALERFLRLAAPDDPNRAAAERWLEDL